MKNTKTEIFFPNLDALRFFCFISVFFFHSFATKYNYIQNNGAYQFIKYGLFGNGNLGVNFFFVLSGFLITYLLLVEKTSYRKVHVGNFYIRRMLRIWPLFYFCVFFGFVLFPAFKSFMGGTPNEIANPLMYITFLNNIDLVYNGAPDSSVLSILWSVAIEEQFYLVWPLIIGFVRPKYLPYVFSGIILFSFIFRYRNAANSFMLETHTFSCISDMTIGGLGAYLSFFSEPFKKMLYKLSPGAIVCIYLGAVLLFFFRKSIFETNHFLLAIDRLVISIFFLFIILEQNFSLRSFFKLKSLKLFSRLGQYTYGLYCLHMIGILIAATLLAKFHFNTHVWQVLLLEGGLSLGLTILLAHLSYHFYEKKFLQLKKRFAYVKTDKSTRELEATGVTKHQTDLINSLPKAEV